MIFDGHTIQKGADSSSRVGELSRLFSSLSVNRQYRRGKNSTRPPFKSLELIGDDEAIDIFQNRTCHASFGYRKVRPKKQPCILIYAGDALIKARIFARNLELSILKRGLASNVRHGFFVQAEDYVFFQNGVDTPLVFDGIQLTEVVEGLELSDGTKIEVPMPIGNVMCYAHGRIFVATTDNLVYASDHLYSHGVSATSPLTLGSFLEGTYPSSGGSFSAPSNFGSLTGISVIPRHPEINGHGEVIVFHEEGAYTIDAQRPRNEWSDNPIQNIILVGRGCAGPFSVIGVNNDIWYRATDLTVASFKHSVTQLRQNWGDKSLSREVQIYLDFDTGLTAQFTRALKTKNRLLYTCAHREQPANYDGDADHHFALGIVSLDFDSGSTVSPDLEFSWDGVWTGLRVVDVAKVYETYNARYLFISFDSDSKNRVYELRETELGNDEVDGQISRIDSFYVIENIFSQLNTNQEIFQKRIYGAKVEIEDVREKMFLSIGYRPDNYSAWAKILKDEQIGADADEITQDELDARQAVFYGTIIGESPEKVYDEIYKKGYVSTEGFDILVEIAGVASVKSLSIGGNAEKAEIKYQNSSSVKFANGTTTDNESEMIFRYRIR